MPARIINGDLVITPAPKTITPEEACGGLFGELRPEDYVNVVPSGGIVAAEIPTRPKHDPLSIDYADHGWPTR